MRIGVLTTGYPRWPGDYAGSFIQPLNRQLATRHGHKITVVAPHDSGLPRQEDWEEGTVRRFGYFWPPRYQRLAYGAGIPTNLRTSLLARMQVPLFLAAFLTAAARAAMSSDLLHAHWVEPGMVGLCVRPIRRLPLVITVHRFNPSRFILPMYRRVLHKADAVLFNSSYTLGQAAHAGIRCNGLVVPIGVDLERMRPDGDNLRRRFDIPAGAKVVGTLGRMVEVKGQRFLLDAFRHVLSQHPPAVLLMGGDGPLRLELTRQAKDLGLEGKVRWAGVVDGPDVPAFMRSCDVFCLPSIPDSHGDTEALGVVLIEAMACGVPCVASRTGGIVDSVIDGQTGLLCRPGDGADIAQAIGRLLDDNALGRYLIDTAAARVKEHFSLTAVADRVDRLYQDVLSGTPSREA